jgi:hypothetical protein
LLLVPGVSHGELVHLLATVSSIKVSCLDVHGQLIYWNYLPNSELAKVMMIWL